MKSEKLLDAIGSIDDNLVHNAVNEVPQKKKGAGQSLLPMMEVFAIY